ncbi:MULTISPECIES: toxin VasX [unclassified Pseudomonas]|uniref:toxin VasX n=2 Tax=Pseudomonas TaxID=286 RepID=UPI002AC9E37A|nr:MULTISPECIES: toxin VasX [unclassified Pseudomonas]MEB0080332.1 hypothetical protein [Pseudomonas sp. MH10out]MEB0133539.1 hypothetical protein [Pseudomonas sp. CCI2.4]MEB0160830.1 hypothetical protein [Pseudomonas sp. AH2 (2023)]MEB0170375.1 hypothetical protein [Pseudomonas sp. CCC4.4]WPX26477.1 hypothetical protein RHM64_16140 [Pseudomonas sp. AH2]
MNTNRRIDPNLAAAAESKSDILSYGTCPLRQPKVQLLPLRYGLVEHTVPTAEVALPYALQTRPLGVRLLRNGWLYIIDNGTGVLHEYRITNGLVSALVWEGKQVSTDQRSAVSAECALIFSRASTLNVTYAEVQWTAAKCNRMLNSEEERARFMQSVSLVNVSCERGAKNLLTLEQTQRWLAELAQDEQLCPVPDDVPADERAPYLWEQPAYFRELHLGELLKPVLPLYQNDTLCLVVEDDLGVLRDLANYQDKVVGWIEAWANGGSQPGANERDYLLACYIEALSLLDETKLTGIAAASDDPALKAMLEELDQLPSPQRGHAGRALLDHLNNCGRAVSTYKDDPPQALLALRQEASDQFRKEEGFFASLALGSIKTVIIQDVDWRYHTRQFMAPAPDDFVERHLKALVQLGKDQTQRIKDVLSGAKLGQRGVNELIDRAAMDQTLAEHRARLMRWNALLDQITTDRITLVTADRFHRAAWYFDAQHQEQMILAFSAEYACLKDICRSDAASQAILDWLETKPQFSLPLLHTLPFSEQTQLSTQYAALFNAGYGLINNIPHWTEVSQHIGHGKIPAIDALPASIRVLAEGARDAITPALRLGMERMQDEFVRAINSEKIPDLDQLFRNLPKALAPQIIEAARREGVTFTVATPEELASLQRDIKEVFNQRYKLKVLDNERKQIVGRRGHKEPGAQELQHQIHGVRGSINVLETRLALAISPIAELPDESMRLWGVAPGRAGVTVLFPPAQQQEIGRLLANVRKGMSAAPKLNVLGDGAGLLVFLAQFVNLVVAAGEARKNGWDDQSLHAVFSAFLATATAGFTAVRAIADTALTARAASLAGIFQQHAVADVYVQLGKLHIGLGVLSSTTGILASKASLGTHYDNWQQAVRSGKTRLENSAAVAMLGAGGQLTSYSYDLGNVLYSAYTVIAARDTAARTAAWAAAGVRLSTVFFRMNIAGALFTVVELGGTWLYNRYNLSPHDQWLESTPWGLDDDKREALSLGDYKRKLTGLLQALQAQVGPKHYADRWQDMLMQARPGSIHLVMPGLSLANLQAPLSGKASHVLSIGAYRVITAEWERGRDQDRWAIVSEEVIASLQVVQSAPLILELFYPDERVRPSTVTRARLILAVSIETYDADGSAHNQLYYLSLDPKGEGVFPVAPFEPPYRKAERLVIDPLMLEMLHG